MIRASLMAAAVISTVIVAGCGGPKSFNDAAARYDQKLQKKSCTDLNFVGVPVRDAVAQMQDKFHCRIAITSTASDFIGAGDLRLTAQVESIPKNLAFAVLRAELEFKGLVLISEDNAFGRPSYILDRGLERDLVTAAKAGGTDY